MFNAISEYTLFIFAGCNILTIPMVWALYPETNQRTLEEMNLLFAADTPWVWDAEKNYARLIEENPDLVMAAQRGQSVSGDLEGAGAAARRRSSTGGARKFSLAGGTDYKAQVEPTKAEHIDEKSD